MKIHVLLFIVCLSLFFISCESAEAKKKKQCDVLDKEFGKVLLAGSDECKTDADCVCYPAGYIVEPCGGITNKTTDAALRIIDKKSDALGCGYRAMCGAWICNPKCKNGLCANAPRN